MTETAALTIHIDGAARGNPGPAAFAYIIAGDGLTTIEESGCLKFSTNNQAEYTALIQALQRATGLGRRHLVIFSDSELLVKQMNGVYRVKNPDLQTLHERANQLCRQFETVSIRHVSRSQNVLADRLCNKALDEQAGSARSDQAKRQGNGRTSISPREAAVREEAVTCLRAAAVSWARGDPAQPKPEDVWDQLWTILEENGILRRPRSH